LGPRLVDGLAGSALAKRRLRLILETVSGERSVAEACAELGISEAAFHKLRGRFLAESVGLLEPRSAGRPPASPPETGPSLADLKAENRELRLDLQAARIREELAIVMPHLLKRRRPGSKRGTRRRQGPRRGSPIGGARDTTPSGCGVRGKPALDRRAAGEASGPSATGGRPNGR
jgi:hypothetical protein